MTRIGQQLRLPRARYTYSHRDLGGISHRRRRSLPQKLTIHLSDQVCKVQGSIGDCSGIDRSKLSGLHVLHHAEVPCVRGEKHLLLLVGCKHTLMYVLKSRYGMLTLI